eukprot:scaffold3587_cov364-Prasinococcus_capsulatus_cf.AAC.13
MPGQMSLRTARRQVLSTRSSQGCPGALALSRPYLQVGRGLQPCGTARPARSPPPQLGEGAGAWCRPAQTCTDR